MRGPGDDLERLMGVREVVVLRYVEYGGKGYHDSLLLDTFVIVAVLDRGFEAIRTYLMECRRLLGYTRVHLAGFFHAQRPMPRYYVGSSACNSHEPRSMNGDNLDTLVAVGLLQRPSWIQAFGLDPPTLRL